MFTSFKCGVATWFGFHQELQSLGVIWILWRCAMWSGSSRSSDVVSISATRVPYFADLKVTQKTNSSRSSLRGSFKRSFRLCAWCCIRDLARRFISAAAALVVFLAGCGPLARSWSHRFHQVIKSLAQNTLIELSKVNQAWMVAVIRLRAICDLFPRAISAGS